MRNEEIETKADKIVSDVARYYSISADDIRSEDMYQRGIEKKWLCLKHLKRLGYPISDIGDIFRLKPNSIYEGIRKLNKIIPCDATLKRADDYLLEKYPKKKHGLYRS